MMEHIAPWRDLGMEHPQTKVLVHSRNHGGFRAIFHTDRWTFFWSSIFLWFIRFIKYRHEKNPQGIPSMNKVDIFISGCWCQPLSAMPVHVSGPRGSSRCVFHWLDGIKHQAIQAIQKQWEYSTSWENATAVAQNYWAWNDGAWLNTKHE